MENKNRDKLVVIGGGAAGFFCAVNAARMNPDLDVVILEKSDKLLSKVKISGGGRCNVTHACTSIADMASRYPRGNKFAKKTFHHFFVQDTTEWFAARGVVLKTESDGRMFPDTDSSQTIIDCLLHEASRYHVRIQMKSEVKKISGEKGAFTLTLQSGDTISATYVCVTCGGYPKSQMFDWIRDTGHHVEEPVPSLFTFNIPKHSITELMGLSVAEAEVKITGSKLKQSGPLLITHWGLSGPAVLKLSAWGARLLAAVQWHFTVMVNWMPAYNEETLRAEWQQIRMRYAGQMIQHKNPFGLPARLWHFLLHEAGIGESCRWADLPAKGQNRLAKCLCAYEMNVRGKTTYKEEFVTAGGVSLSEIAHDTMESKKVKGLYFAGEILDIDGITGGFNFQNAWTTAYIAAESIAKKDSR